MLKRYLKATLFSILCITIYLTSLNLSLEMVFPTILSKITPVISNFITYKKVDIKIFPYPLIKIKKIRSKKQKNFSFTLNILEISPYLPGLFYKKPLNIRIYNGTIDIREIKHKKGTKVFNPYNVPIGSLEIENINVSYMLNKHNILLKKVYLNTGIGHSSIRIKGNFISNIAKKTNLYATISSQRKKIDVNFQEISVNNIIKFFSHPPHLLKKIKGNINLHISSILENNDIKATINMKSPHLMFHSPIKNLELKAKSLFNIRHRAFHINVEKLKIIDPYIDLTGNISHKKNNTTISIYTKKIDISRVREFYKKSSFRNKISDKIFSIVKSGIFSYGEFKLKLNKHNREWSLRGNCSSVDLNIPHINLDLNKLSGIINIENNILNCKKVKGFYRNSFIKEGYLTLGLNHQLYPFIINTNVNFKLKDLIPLLYNLNTSKKVLNYLEKIDIQKGGCKGVFTLNKHKNGKYIWNVYAKDIITYGYIEKNNMPVKIKIDTFRLRNNIMEINKAIINLQNTNINSIKLHTDFNKQEIVINLSKSYIYLKEANQIYSIFTQKKLPLTISGNLHINSISIDYNWKLNKIIDHSIDGNFDNLTIHDVNLKNFLTQLKYSIKTNINIQKGEFSGDSKKLSISLSNTSILDSSFNSLKINTKGTIASPEEINIDLSGHLFKRLIHVLKDNIPFLRNINIAHRLHISSMSLNIIPNKSIKVILDTAIKKVFVNLSITHIPHKTFFGNMDLKYKDTASVIYFKNTEHNLYLKFKGKIDKNIFDRILTKNKYITGEFKGNFYVNLSLSPFFIKDFYGSLNGHNISILPSMNLKIENFYSTSVKKSIYIKKSCISIFKDKIHINGFINIKRDMNRLSLNIISKKINLDPIIDILDKSSQGKSNVKLQGNINIDLKELVYKNTILKHIVGNIVLNNGFKETNITRGYLCSVPVEISLKNMGESKKLDLKLKGSGIYIQDVISCIKKEEEKLLTGVSDIDATIWANIKKHENPLHTLNGRFSFNFKNGRIYRLTLLSKILSLINSTEIFFGKIPNLKTQGLEYNHARAKGEVNKGVLIFKNSYINATNMELAFHGKIYLDTKKVDITILFAPLKTIDRIIKKIPILRNITGGNLLVVPFQVKGTIESPILLPLSPKAVGSELLGILKNTIKLPYTIFQPITPKK